MYKFIALLYLMIQSIQVVDSFYSTRFSNTKLSVKQLPSLSTSTLTSTSLTSTTLSPISSLTKLLTPSNQIKIARISIISILGLTLIFTDSINQTIAILWESIRNNYYFRHDLFEPMVAVSSFFFWVHGFYIMEKSGLLDQYSISKRKVTRVNESGLSSWYSSWLFRELPLYLGPLYLLSIFFDAFKPRRMALLQAAPSIWTILGQIIGGLFFYDLFFFFTHLPLHSLGRRAFNFLHGRHHSNSEVRAVDTIKLTAIEEFIDVGCSIAALRLLHAHPLSRSLYNFVITGLLTELHCGYNH